MAEPFNPYAPPTAPVEPVNASDVWRDGKALVLRPGASLPPRCVKCNAPAREPRRRRKVYWHHQAIYLLVLLNLLIYLIVALIVRKQAEVDPGLCIVHARRRLLGILLGWGGAVLGIAVGVAGIAYDSCGIEALGGVVFLGSIIAGLLMARILYPVRIDKELVRLKGCGGEFLDSLPPFQA